MRASILTKIFLVLGLMAGAALMIAFHAVLGVDKVSRSVPLVEEAAEHARLAEQLDGLVNLGVMHSRLLYLADTPEKAKEASARLAEAIGAIRTADLHWLDGVAQHAKLDSAAIRAALAAFVTARQALVDLGAKGDFSGAKAAGDNDTARAPRLALSADIDRLKRAAAVKQKEEGRAAQTTLLEARATVSVIAISCVLLAFGLAVVLSVHLIGGPVRSLTAIMKRLAQGETDMVIPESSRTDEIGEMERALHVLRDTVKRNSDLVNELRSRDATEVLLRGQAAMGDRVMVFDQTLRSWIGRLAMLIGRLTEAAGTMTAASMRSREGTEAITVASRRAAADADNVAGSAELLSHAVEDIEQRIVDSAALVRQAVDRARATGDTVDELSSFSGRVGTIVQVIGEIAGQTNLLALNATIEAARAGEYGRGFAVVAQEVKTLASQTAKATAEITDQIAAIQRASHASAEALAAIQGKIAEVDRNSTAIALTADQQRSSTRHIASSIRATADHAKDMAQLAESLETASQEGATSAATFVAIVRDIDAEAVAMGREVERFFAGLKVA